jgi:multidrug transporter EmrE-like cation transporter
MNAKRIGYIALIVIGIVCTFLNGWVFLLEREGRFLLFALMGILVIIAGVVRLRRQT